MKVLASYIWKYVKKLLHLIGRVNTFIILSLFYFVAFAPVALFKIAGRIFFRKTEQNSYWIKRAEPIDPESAKYQF